MLIVHDYEISSYEVNLKEEIIVIHTECRRGKDTKIDILFSGVLAHYFENVMRNSIILDVEECDINLFTKDNIELLEKHKNSCWPIDFDKVEDLSNMLKNEKYSYFIISSSFGLNGWVLAKKMNQIDFL